MNILRTNSSCARASSQEKHSVNTEQVNVVQIKSYSQILLLKKNHPKVIEYLRMNRTVESCNNMEVQRREISRKWLNYIPLTKDEIFANKMLTGSKCDSCTRNIVVRCSVYGMFANGNLILYRTRFSFGSRDTQFRSDQLKASAELLWNVQRRLV